MSVDVTKCCLEFCNRESEFKYGNVRIRWFGITTLLFDDGKTQVLFDASVTRPGMLQVVGGTLVPNEALIAKLIEEYDIDRLKGIFVSHTHYDHVLDMPAFAKLTGAEVYGSRSTINVAKGNGIARNKSHEFAAEIEYKIGDFSITVIPSKHSPARIYNNDLGKEIKAPLSYPTRKKYLVEGGSFDFYVTNGKERFLIHPSCNYIPKLLEKYQADVMFYSIGQMDRMSLAQKEISYQETIGAVKPKVVIPVHWDNFFLPLNKANYAFSVFDRPIRSMKYLDEKLRQDGSRFLVLPFASKA